MNSQDKNNDETSAIGILVAFVAMAAIIFFIAVLAFAAFVTFLLTLLCAVSWNSETTIGKYTFEPEWARAFVYRGLAGAVLTPAFIVFCGIAFLPFMDGPYSWQPIWWLYTIGFGYVAGSYGIETIRAFAEEDTKEEIDPTLWLPPSPPRMNADDIAFRSDASPQRPPFTYGSWDDEVH